MLELIPAYLDKLQASNAVKPLGDVNLKFIVLDFNDSKLKFRI